MTKSLTATIAVFASVAIGIALGTDHAFVALIPMVVLLGLWAQHSPASALVAAIWISALRPIAVESYGVPRELALVADLVVLASLMAVLLRGTANGRRLARAQSGVMYGLMLFVFIAVISTVFNGSSLLDAVGATRALTLGPMAYVVGYSVSADPKGKKILQQSLLGVLILECVLALLQFPSAAIAGNPDLVVGTFGSGGANVLGLFCLVGVPYVLSVEWLRPSRAIALALMLSIPIVLSSSRVAMLLLPLVWLVVYWSKIRAVGPRLLLALVSVLLAVGTLSVYAAATGRSPADEFDLGVITRGQVEVRAGNVPRLAYFSYLVAPLNSRPWGWIIGLGPGQFASGYAISRSAPNAEALVSRLRVTATGYTSGGYTYLDGEIPVTSQIVSTLSEYGLVGLLCYAAIPVMVLLRARRSRVRTARVFIWVAAGATLFGSVWANLWELQVWAIVWCMLSNYREAEVD